MDMGVDFLDWNACKKFVSRDQVGLGHLNDYGNLGGVGTKLVVDFFLERNVCKKIVSHDQCI